MADPTEGEMAYARMQEYMITQMVHQIPALDDLPMKIIKLIARKAAQMARMIIENEIVSGDETGDSGERQTRENS